MRWFLRHLPPSGVHVENVSLSRLGFQIAGPRARELLARVAATDVSSAALPFLSVVETEIGLVPATVCRLTYTGDLGYEIYVAAEAPARAAPRAHGGRPRPRTPALRHARDDVAPPGEALRRLAARVPARLHADGDRPRALSCATTRTTFIGRDAAVRERDEPPARRLCGLAIDVADADPWADEPIWHEDKVVGFVTSGGYAHHSGLSIALGMLPRERIAPDDAFEVEILGERRPARLLTEPPYDPQGTRMRA